MKRFLSYAMAAAFVFGLAACSKDVEMGGGGADDGSLVATFTLQTPQGAFITYADIAEGEEWTLNNLDVYAFDVATKTMIGSGKLVKDTDYEISLGVAGKATTTIKVKNSWLAPYAGKEVQFYFVGNDIAGTNGAIKAPHVVAKTAQADFEKQMTVALAATTGTPDMMSEIIRTPLLFSAVAEPVTLIGRVQAKATLTRREARFDILNKYAAETTPLVVTAIKVSNAPRSGKIFAATGSDAVLWASIDHTKIDVPVYADGDYTAETDTKAPAEQTYRAKSVFYLYPTILGEDAAHTSIVIEATMGTQTLMFTRAKEDATGTAIPAKEITANYRYTLVLDPLSLTYEITKADYTDGGEVETVAGGDDTFSSILGTPAITNNTVAFADDALTEQTVTIESQYGAAYKIEDVIGASADLGITVTPTRTTTYAYATKDVFEIKIPGNSDGKAYHFAITFYSPNGEASETINFTKGAYSDPKLADAIQNAIPEGGTVEDITSLDVSGTDGPSSLEGIENLPNLTEIDATGNTNLSGKIDLSESPNLETVIFKNTNITEIDVTENLALKHLHVQGTLIETLNISQNTALTFLNIQFCSLLTSLDVSNNDLLKEIYLSDTPLLASFTFGSNPVLHSLHMQRTGLVTLDISSLTGLQNLYAENNSKLTAVTLGVNNASITTIRVHETKVSSLALTYCPQLIYLQCNGSAINALDLSNNKELKSLYFGRGGAGTFPVLDISANTKLTTFYYVGISSHTVNVTAWKDFPESEPESAFIEGRYGNTGGSNIIFTAIQ